MALVRSPINKPGREHLTAVHATSDIDPGIEIPPMGAWKNTTEIEAILEELRFYLNGLQIDYLRNNAVKGIRQTVYINRNGGRVESIFLLKHDTDGIQTWQEMKRMTGQLLIARVKVLLISYIHKLPAHHKHA